MVRVTNKKTKLWTWVNLNNWDPNPPKILSDGIEYGNVPKLALGRKRLFNVAACTSRKLQTSTDDKLE